jgi:hypothetical protein
VCSFDKSINDFFRSTTRVHLIDFLYGMAFFSLGLTMLLESYRVPLLVEVRLLRPLAAFGFLHSLLLYRLVLL